MSKREKFALFCLVIVLFSALASIIVLRTKITPKDDLKYFTNDDKVLFTTKEELVFDCDHRSAKFSQIVVKPGTYTVTIKKFDNSQKHYTIDFPISPVASIRFIALHEQLSTP